MIEAAELQATLEAALAGTSLPGAMARVVYRDGQATEAAVGFAADSVFELASMTKPLVSVAALQLVEQGRIGLDEPVSRIVPALDSPDVLTGFDGERPLKRKARVPITLRHLLSHSAGFGYAFMEPYILKALGKHPEPGRRAGLLTPLLFEPGTGWAYGSCSDWLGLVIEAVSGEPLDRLLHERVLSPLGMTDTQYGRRPDQKGRVPAMVARGADGSLAPMPGFATWSPDHDYVPGGAGLCGTAADFGRFLHWMLGEGAPLLGPTLMDAFCTNQLAPGIAAGRLGTLLPWLSLASDPHPGTDCGWGLGTLVHLAPGPDGRAAGSLSWGGIANTSFWADRKAGLAVVLMLQLLPFGDPVALTIRKEVEQLVYKR